MIDNDTELKSYVWLPKKKSYTWPKLSHDNME